MPVSLPVAAPGDAPSSVPGATEATNDAFAAVLAALSGALGIPVAQMSLQVTDAPPPSEGTAAVGAPGVGALGTGTWAAATQRQVVPGITPALEDGPQLDSPVGSAIDATPVVATTAPGKAAKAVAHEAGPAGPWHATHGSEVRATRPAGEHAPFTRLAPQTDAPTVDPAPPAPVLEAEAPVVPVVVEDPAPAVPAPDAALVPPQVAPTTAPAAAAATERPHGVGPAKHVQPAVLEAARGLRHEGGGRTSLVVRLDPPELGAVLVRLTVQDGRVDITLRTPDLVARNDLQAQQYDVQQVLRDQGFDLSSFDVAHGDVFPGNQGDSPDRGTPQRSRGADGRVDDHAPVMDDGLAPEPSGTWL
jgi:chemotaxis protein MotD